MGDEQWIEWLLDRCEEELGEMVDSGSMTDATMDLTMDSLMGVDDLDQLESRIEALGLSTRKPRGDD